MIKWPKTHISQFCTVKKSIKIDSCSTFVPFTMLFDLLFSFNLRIEPEGIESNGKTHREIWFSQF